MLNLLLMPLGAVIYHFIYRFKTHQRLKIIKGIKKATLVAFSH